MFHLASVAVCSVVIHFREQDEEEDKGASQPTNLVEWICTLARQTVEQMKSDQQWQVSMQGSETKYSMLRQLFDHLLISVNFEQPACPA